MNEKYALRTYDIKGWGPDLLDLCLKFSDPHHRNLHSTLATIENPQSGRSG